MINMLILVFSAASIIL